MVEMAEIFWPLASQQSWKTHFMFVVVFVIVSLLCESLGTLVSFENSSTGRNMFSSFLTVSI